MIQLDTLVDTALAGAMPAGLAVSLSDPAAGPLTLRSHTSDPGAPSRGYWRGTLTVGDRQWLLETQASDAYL